MERDTFDAAIDEILAFTSGDIRRALRAVLIESVLLEEKLQQMQRRPAANRQNKASLARPIERRARSVIGGR